MKATGPRPEAMVAPDSTAASGSTSVLVIKGLTKRYNGLIAVDAISFSVSRGETFGILGPNGAGKTTTLEMIEGLRMPDGGDVTLFGIDAVKRRRAVQQRIGVQLQSQALWPDLTVEETLRTFAALFRQNAATAQLLDRFSLTEKRLALVKTLSGGQRQRLAVAVALINNPEVVFLDEPTTGLDPQARHDLWELVRNIRREGKTVILTTHYMEEAESLCDRVAIMDSGRIIALDAPRQLVRDLAFDSTIECAFSPPIATEQLRSLPAVSGVRSEEEAIVLFTADLSTTLAALAGLAETAGVKIHNLLVRTATLEDVFINLTGKRLRD